MNYVNGLRGELFSIGGTGTSFCGAGVSFSFPQVSTFNNERNLLSVNGSWFANQQDNPPTFTFPSAMPFNFNRNLFRINGSDFAQFEKDAGQYLSSINLEDMLRKRLQRRNMYVPDLITDRRTNLSDLYPIGSDDYYPKVVNPGVLNKHIFVVDDNNNITVYRTGNNGTDYNSQVVGSQGSQPVQTVGPNINLYTNPQQTMNIINDLNKVQDLLKNLNDILRLIVPQQNPQTPSDDGSKPITDA